MSLCTVQWSVTPPVQDWLELNPDVIWVKHPSGVERAGGLSLIGWTDAEKQGERKRVRERERPLRGNQLSPLINKFIISSDKPHAA